MGPLQVLYDTIDEPLYDGQYCLAEFILRILFGNILFKYYTLVVKHRNPRYCLASITLLRREYPRDDPSVVPSGGWVWIKMCITSRRGRTSPMYL